MKLRLEMFFFIQCSIHINLIEIEYYSHYCRIMKITHHAETTYSTKYY